MTEHNITLDAQMAFLQMAKQSALALIDSSDVLTVPMIKKDKSGANVLDADGIPVLVDKRVFRKTHVGQLHDARIAHFRATGQYRDV